MLSPCLCIERVDLLYSFLLCLGEKWKSLPKEKQLQFRSEYLAKREDYKKKMESFFEENPEAKPTRIRTTRYVSTYVMCFVITLTDVRTKKVKTIEPSPETMKIKEVHCLNHRSCL